MNHNNGRWIFIPMQIKILVQTYTLVRTKAQKDKYRFLPSSTLCPVIADDSIWQKVHRWYHSHILHKCVSDTQAKNHIFNSPCCLFLASLEKCTLGKDANLHTRWRCIRGCSHITSAKIRGSWTPPSPLRQQWTAFARRPFCTTIFYVDLFTW